MWQKYHRNISNVATYFDDPPDCSAQENGRHISIEVVELVKAEVLQKIDQNRKLMKTYTALSPIKLFDGSKETQEKLDLFRLPRWNKKEFLDRLGLCISHKNEKYHKRAIGPFDVLLILCDELFLQSSDVKSWLLEAPSSEIMSFKEVFLLLGYEPDTPKGRYPLFKIK